MVNPEKFLKGTPAEAHWQKIGIFHHHGILFPLLAIHTEGSCGCGEYTDLKMVIDWAKKCTMDVVQLLPLNDSGEDPSPYNAQSASALHPIYIGLHHLPLLNKEDHQHISQLRRYNDTVKVHYTQVLSEKMTFLRRYIERNKNHFLESPQYESFLSKADWLNEYALFKALKEFHNGQSWIDWPEHHKNPSQTNRRKLAHEFSNDVEFYKLVQYLCYLQLKGAHSYACSQNVFLKGDIPILISPDSCDVWAHPELFDITMAAGAPPDKFNDKWQYWGFPLYNWKAHREEHFRYWKSRLTYASHFYSIYRIDHVVGFFRIWATKRGQHPKYGSFQPEDRRFWLLQGEEILRMMLSASSMLPIAEDLGVVPDNVKEKILSLGIPGTRVFRWERTWDDTFIPFSEFTPLSLATVSTHDTETLQTWWRDEVQDAEVLADALTLPYSEDLTEKNRFAILDAIHHATSLFHINLLQEYLALEPDLVWPNPDDERINIPGYVLPSNWTYKTKTPFETIAAHERLEKKMQALCTKQRK